MDIGKEKNLKSMGSENAGVILTQMTHPTISQINNVLQVIAFPLYEFLTVLFLQGSDEN